MQERQLSMDFSFTGIYGTTEISDDVWNACKKCFLFHVTQCRWEQLMDILKDVKKALEKKLITEVDAKVLNGLPAR